VGRDHVGTPVADALVEGTSTRASTGVTAHVGASPGGITHPVVTVPAAAKQPYLPQISSAPAALTPGLTYQLQASGFLRAPDCTDCPAQGPPLVVFAPDEGPSVVFETTGWTGGVLSFVPVATPFHGRGLLHILLDGAPSKGVVTTLDALGTGTSCAHGSDCASDVCADAVCCDAPCDGPCSTCAATPGVVAGTCHPAPRGADPRGECAADVGNACRIGACDGAGKCELVKDGTSCPGGLCSAGSCVLTASCDGQNRVVASDGSVVTDCGDYRCAAGHCPSACASDGDCVEGLTCASGRCVGHCDDTGEAVVHPGAVTACAPYRCHAGACGATCASGVDCAYGYVCAGAGGKRVCELPAFDTGVVDPGCAISPSTRRSGPAAVVALLALSALARRRRRATTAAG
jgi:hypothetical protein